MCHGRAASRQRHSRKSGCGRRSASQCHARASWIRRTGNRARQVRGREREKIRFFVAEYALVLSVWWRTLEVLRDEQTMCRMRVMLVALGKEQGFAFLHAAGQCQLGWVTARQATSVRG